MRILWAIALLLSSSALAKDPCKTVQSRTSTYGEESRGRVVYIGLHGHHAVSIIETGASTLFGVSHVIRDRVEATIPSGTPGEIELASGEVLTLQSMIDAAPAMKATSSTIFTQWHLSYIVDEANLQKLASAPIVAVRSDLAGNTGSLEVPKKQAGKLQRVAACLVQ